jgi:hypothetical protein
MIYHQYAINDGGSLTDSALSANSSAERFVASLLASNCRLQHLHAMHLADTKTNHTATGHCTADSAYHSHSMKTQHRETIIVPEACHGQHASHMLPHVAQ